jgi:hypothetical protein
MIGTKYMVAHHRIGDDGRRYLIWAPGVGEIQLGELAQGTKAWREAMGDRNWLMNALADEGEKDILDVYFDDVAVRANTYLRLYDDTPVETDTLATLAGEVTGTGYAAITLARGTDWSDPSLDSGDMQTVTPTKTYTAGGAWSAASQLVLATVASGTSGLFLAWAALSATRTLQNTDTLDVTLAVKLA